MSANRKIKVTADLVMRTLNNLDELGVPYALVIEGIPKIFTNSSPLHAEAILARQHQLNEKIADEKIAAGAEKLIDRSEWPKPE